MPRDVAAGPAEQPIHLCIGAPRSGTTWLFNNLLARDDIFVPPVKEVRFWHGWPAPREIETAVRTLKKSGLSADRQAWLARWAATTDFSATAYRELMLGHDRPSIDISPLYSLMPTGAVEKVVRALPESSKVIYLVRDPLDRALSQMRLHLYLRGYFRGAAADGTLRALATNPDQLQRSDYEAVARRWSAAFGSRFRVFDHAGLKRDPRRFLTDICAFLGLDTRDETSLANAATVYGAETSGGRKPYAPDFSPAQRAIVADSIKPVVDRGCSIVPDAVGKSWRDSVNTAARALKPAADEEPDGALQRLMRVTENLGDNCEFGFWQRHRKYEPSSLFRWVLAPAAALPRFLNRETHRLIYRRANLERHSPTMVRDTATEFKFHSKLPAIAGDEEIAQSKDPRLLQLFAEERERILHLRHKFFVQARNKPALYVMKQKALSLDAVRAVAHALWSLNADHVILWVTQGSRDNVEIAENRILSAQIPSFAPYASVNQLDDAAWTRIMEGCLEHDWIRQLLERAIR